MEGRDERIVIEEFKGAREIFEGERMEKLKGW